MARAKLKPHKPKAGHGPSEASLRAIPPLNPETAVRFGRGPEALRKALDFMRVVRGRPKKGETAAGSSTRSLRLPDAAWEELDRKASELKMPPHKLLRWIVASWLYSSERPKSKNGVKRRRRAA